jgi:hypothetical protein
MNRVFRRKSNQNLALVLCLACLVTLLILRPEDEVATVLLAVLIVVAVLIVAAILARKR